MIPAITLLLATALPSGSGFAIWWVKSIAIAPQARAASGRRSSTRGTNPLGRTPEVISEGRGLYNSSCTVCHGLDGTAGDRAPALAAARRYLRNSDDDLFSAIKNGIPGTLMPAAQFPDDGVWKIVAYIRNLRATASDETVEGAVEQGAKVFQGKGGCVTCHMVRGRGGMLGPDLSNIAAERSVRYLRNALTESRPNIPAGFQPVRLTMKSGETVDGIVKNENNFSLQVMDRNYTLHLLQRDDIVKTEYDRRSLMPYNYGTTLTAAELQDLLAFLSRQVRQ